MPIAFYQKRKIQQYLIPVFIVVLLTTTAVLWMGFRKKQVPSPEAAEVFRPEKEVKINFEVLENPLLQQLEPFEKIKPFEETSRPDERPGRTSPFSPY